MYCQHARNVYGVRTGWAGVIGKAKVIRSGWYRRQILQNGRYLQRTVEEQAALFRVERLEWRDRLWISLRSPSLRRRLWDGLALSVLSLAIGREKFNTDL